MNITTETLTNILTGQSDIETKTTLSIGDIHITATSKLGKTRYDAVYRGHSVLTSHLYILIDHINCWINNDHLETFATREDFINYQLAYGLRNAEEHGFYTIDDKALAQMARDLDNKPSSVYWEELSESFREIPCEGGFKYERKWY